MNRHLAQLNIATLRYPIDDPRIADFVDALPLVNGAGEATPGYVWRLQSESGDATDIRVFDDPLVIVNLTVWESLEALRSFAYRGVHRNFFRRRAEWFVAGSSRTALWWLPADVLPTTEDARRRLDFIDAFGASLYAFETAQLHQVLVIERVSADDGRAQRMITLPNGVADVVGDSGALVVAEIDGDAAACGGYRMLDEHTAEIKHMYVAPSARGLRVGAAIVAELEAVARTNRIERLLLETGPRQLPSLALYEKFGFTPCPPGAESGSTPRSIRIEKALTTEPSRLA